MSEEQKEFYEIKKSSVKQFLIIVCGSFIGCLLALILMGQIMKPKFPPCPYGWGMMAPAPMAQFHHRGMPEHHFKKHFQCDRPAPHRIKMDDKRFNPPEKVQRQLPPPAPDRK